MATFHPSTCLTRHHTTILRAAAECRKPRFTSLFLRLCTSLLLAIGANASMAQQPALPSQVASQVSEEQSRAMADRLAWHRKMATVAKPTSGCFTATFPSEEWKETQCTTAPKMPHRRPPPLTKRVSPTPPAEAHAEPPGLAVAGNGNDLVAVAVGGPISAAEGYFNQTMDIQTVADVSPNQSVTGAYALQINVDPFSTPAACAHAQNPQSCLGWLQYLFMNDNNGSLALMEVWLFNFGPTCPGQGSVPQLPGVPAGTLWYSTGNDCVFDSPTTPLLAVQPISSIGQLRMRAEARAGGQDSVTITFPDGSIHGVAIPDAILNLSAVWKQVEFNVFGYVNAQRAIFNSGAALVTNIGVENGTTNAPTIINTGFTGETNNFNLVSPGCSEAGVTPGIAFEEITVPYQESLACPPKIPVPPPVTQATLCKEATAAVAAAQTMLTNAQARLNTPACAGAARFLCIKTIATDQTLLSGAIAHKNAVCKP
jgi:hypothetical protein